MRQNDVLWLKLVCQLNRLNKLYGQIFARTLFWGGGTEMNQQLKNNLILVGVIFALVIIGYYVFSPYENCMRDYVVTWDDYPFCSQNTDW